MDIVDKIDSILNESTKSKLDKADKLLKSLDFTNDHYIRNDSDWTISPKDNNAKDIVDALKSNGIKSEIKNNKIILM